MRPLQRTRSMPSCVQTRNPPQFGYEAPPEGLDRPTELAPPAHDDARRTAPPLDCAVSDHTRPNGVFCLSPLSRFKPIVHPPNLPEAIRPERSNRSHLARRVMRLVRTSVKDNRTARTEERVGTRSPEVRHGPEDALHLVHGPVFAARMSLYPAASLGLCGSLRHPQNLQLALPRQFVQCLLPGSGPWPPFRALS